MAGQGLASRVRSARLEAQLSLDRLRRGGAGMLAWSAQRARGALAPWQAIWAAWRVARVARRRPRYSALDGPTLIMRAPTLLGAVEAPDHGFSPGRARRVVDIALSGLGLAVLGLPLAVLMLTVRLDSRGPALFRQTRIGQGGRAFTLYKLRSMQVNASGPDITSTADTRVTRLGRLLRATSVDELPQLWNVLVGDMTLVGPRPETSGLAAEYPSGCQWVFSYRPGLTGPAQVRMRDADVLGSQATPSVEQYLHDIVPARASIEATYLAQPSLRATFGVLADTVRHLAGAAVSQR